MQNFASNCRIYFSSHQTTTFSKFFSPLYPSKSSFLRIISEFQLATLSTARPPFSAHWQNNFVTHHFFSNKESTSDFTSFFSYFRREIGTREKTENVVLRWGSNCQPGKFSIFSASKFWIYPQPKGFVAQPYAQQVATFNPTVGSKPTVLPAQAAGQAGFQIQPQFHQIGQQPQLIAAQPRAISMQPGMIQPMMQYRPQVRTIGQ